MSTNEEEKKVENTPQENTEPEKKEETNENSNEGNSEPLTPEQEKEIYSDLRSKDDMKKGDTYYLISAIWWEKWREYIGWNQTSKEGTSRPGPIDNNDLLDENGLLIKEMQEHNNYLIISEALWQNLIKWYFFFLILGFPKFDFLFFFNYSNIGMAEVLPCLEK